MKNLYLPMNLQFFAEEVAEPAGATESEVAEPTTENAEAGAEQTGEEEQEVAEPAESTQVQSAEENARYAAARRAAEAEKKMTDSRFAKLFGGHTNPITGKPIQSAQDYLDALEAQQQSERMKELEKNGVNPQLLNEAIMNSPIMKQAQQYMADQNQKNAAAQLEKDLKVISAIDPTIKSLDDLAAQENFSDIMDLVKKHNLTVDMAYKLANMDKITQKRTDAAKQAAINQAKGLQHMSPTTGGSKGDAALDIPAADLGRWKQMFPEATEKELKEKYNRVLKVRR